MTALKGVSEMTASSKARLPLAKRQETGLYEHTPCLGDVFNDDVVEVTLVDIGMSILDLNALFLGSDRGHDGMATCEERVEYVGSNKATSAWER